MHQYWLCLPYINGSPAGLGGGRRHPQRLGLRLVSDLRLHHLHGNHLEYLLIELVRVASVYAKGLHEMERQRLPLQPTIRRGQK